MEPSFFIALATSTLSLLRATGVVKTSADKLASETGEDVKSLLRRDLNAGLGALELAANTDSDTRRRRALQTATDRFELATRQDRLPPHSRGLASSILAALAFRDSDLGSARYWIGKSALHYDQALRELHELAQKAVLWQRRYETSEEWGINPSTLLLGPLVGRLAHRAVGPATARKFAQHTTRRLPTQEWVDELCAQAVATNLFAISLSCPNINQAVGLELERDVNGAVCRSELILRTTK